MNSHKRYLADKREALFPNLRKDVYEVTSSESGLYNCIAHAAGKSDLWWWPLEAPAEGVFWPAGVDREETVDAFVAAFCTEGYRPCEPVEDGPAFIDGFEKVAIYTNSDGFPSHAAKQTADGNWTSKLGRWEDISHRTLEDLERHADGRPGYGMAVRFLIRAIRLTNVTQQEPAAKREQAAPAESAEKTQSCACQPGRSSPIRR